MVRMFRSVIRAVRLSPNAYAFVGGWLMIFVPFYYTLTVIVAVSAIQGGLATSPLLSMIAPAIRFAVDSSIVGIALVASAIAGFTLVLMGVTRVFRPSTN